MKAKFLGLLFGAGIGFVFAWAIPASASLLSHTSPAGRTDPPKLAAFRQWLLASVQSKP